MFEFETRTCTCGKEWEALTFWPDDAQCTECGRRTYAAALEDINAGRPYRATSIGGACPTQAEGEWIDGQEFYFRARHGRYSLSVDPKDAVLGEQIAVGDDPSHGFMTYGEVVAILDAAANYTPPTDAAEAAGDEDRHA